MFTKISRYRKLPEVTVIDSRGRRFNAKALRLLPQVSGRFAHTVTTLDRLDHLAHQYYKQPRKWWRICDANPEVMSPQALLGKEPVITQRFPLTVKEDKLSPPWAELCQQLLQQVGVEDIQILEEIQLVKKAVTEGGKPVIIDTEDYQRAVLITYNQLNVDSQQLIDLIEQAGFKSQPPETLSRIGQSITIPADSTE